MHMTLEKKYYLVVTQCKMVNSRQEMFFANTINYLLYLVVLGSKKDNLG